MGENKKELEVVSGDGSNLDISPVYEHLNSEKPKTDEKKPKNIVIPKPKSKISSIDNEENGEKESED